MRLILKKYKHAMVKNHQLSILKTLLKYRSQSKNRKMITVRKHKNCYMQVRIGTFYNHLKLTEFHRNHQHER